MTDANLMEADCVHGVTWYECQQCPQPGPDIPQPPDWEGAEGEYIFWLWSGGEWRRVFL